MIRYGYPLIALAGLAFFITWQGHIPYPVVTGDAYRYVAMARQPFGSSNPFAHEPPYAWRLLTPLLVHFLPFPTFTGFWVITLFGLTGATLALLWFLRGLGLSREATIAGGIAFVFLMPAVGFTLYDDTLVDPLAFALLTFALACAIYRHGLLLFLSLIILAVDKEVAVFGAVFAIAWSWQKYDRIMVRWSLLSMAGTLYVLLALHTFIPIDQPFSLVSTFEMYATRTYVQPARLLLALCGAWGILLPIAASAPDIWRNHACWLLLLLATLQLLVSSDIERVVVYAFPVMIAAACFTVEDLARRWQVARWWFWLPIFALEISWTYTYGPHYFFTFTSLHILLMGLLVVAAASIIAIRTQQYWQHRFQI